VEVASSRYFGTPAPPVIKAGRKNLDEKVFEYITQRRDLIEQQVEKWCAVYTRMSDPRGEFHGGQAAGCKAAGK
jgi:D-alanine-D-alanine ligase